MARSKANANFALANQLIQLKRHLRSCKPCTDARKADDPHSMCRDGLNKTLACADKYDALISLRIESRKDSVAAFIPCPRPEAHGAAYALMATPLLSAGSMDALF